MRLFAASVAMSAAAAASRTFRSLSRTAISWIPTGMPQQTLAAAVSRTGVGLHSGGSSTATLLPAAAGDGRYFAVAGGGGGEEVRVAATVENAVESPLCTTLRRDGALVRTVEHVLSALEALGVDNCRIEIDGANELPLFDGSAKEWVEGIQNVGLCAAKDGSGQTIEKLAPKIHEVVCLQKHDSFIAAFPSSQIRVSYGIYFPEVSAIGSQWFSTLLDAGVYSDEIASARTFCIYEEIEKMRDAGLIKGGTLENAIVCSMTGGWLNPPLRFNDEPCRHKILDLVGDFSLLAQNGNQGFPIAHIVAYKAGHTLHTNFLRHLSRMITQDREACSLCCRSSDITH